MLYANNSIVFCVFAVKAAAPIDVLVTVQLTLTVVHFAIDWELRECDVEA